MIAFRHFKRNGCKYKMDQRGIVLVVSVSIFKDEEVLMIKENKPTAIGKWNFPSGHIEYGEDILSAALREVKEETGYEVKFISTTGVYNFQSSTGDQVILFHFTAKLSGGSLNLTEEEIIDCKWIKLNELAKMEDKELREVGVIRQITNNLQRGNLFPISMFHDQLLSTVGGASITKDSNI